MPTLCPPASTVRRGVSETATLGFAITRFSVAWISADFTSVAGRELPAACAKTNTNARTFNIVLLLWEYFAKYYQVLRELGQHYWACTLWRFAAGASRLQSLWRS